MIRLPRRYVFACCCLAMLAIPYIVTVPALCLTSISDELGLTTAQQGIFLSGPYWGLAVAILITGPLADRIGFRWLMVGSAAFISGGLALVAAAHTFVMMVGGAAVIGAGAGMSDTLITPIACALYPDKRARMTSLLHSFFPIGLVASVLLLMLLEHWHWPWRAQAHACALLALPYGAVFAFIPLPGQTHEEGTERLSSRALLRDFRFWLFCLAMLIAGTTEVGPSQWLPNFVERAAHGGKFQGGLGLLAFGLTMAAGRLSLSAMVQRLGVRKVYAAGAALCILGLGMAAWSSSASGGMVWRSIVGQTHAATGQVWGSIFWLSMVGLGVAGFWPTTLASTADTYPRGGASMYSLLSAAGNIGGIVGPIAIGLVADRIGLSGGMAVLAIAPAVSTAAMLFLLARRK